jgi:hypothetical protein
MKLEQKLTVATLGWKRRNIEEAVEKISDTDRVLLGRIAGVAVGTKASKDVNDELIYGLKGNFRGQNVTTGEMVSSGVCYLPSGIQGMIEQDLADARQQDPNATVRFAVDIFAIRAKNKAGYSFNADNILPSETGDPVSGLLDQAQKLSPLAIAAPTATDEKKGK